MVTIKKGGIVRLYDPPNPEHVELVKGGSKAIDEWRRHHPEGELNLRGVDLRGVDLAGADLRYAWLKMANLEAGKLQDAKLWGAELTKAKLANANLRGAELWSTELEGADLSGADLKGADLDSAYMKEAELKRANLTYANLELVNFDFADLSGADLENARISRARGRAANLQGVRLTNANVSCDLGRADLRHAVLTSATLGGSFFHGADLSGTNLKGADLSFACMGSTVLSDIDLSEAMNLVEVNHDGPSIIDVHTIVRSRGAIPEKFMRGCGYDPVIQRMLCGTTEEGLGVFQEWSTRHRLSHLQSCFISYTTADKIFCERLQKALNERGVDYWYAPEHGRWGERIERQIDQEIAKRDRVILVCSEASLREREWIEWEIERAVEEEEKRGRPVIFPIMIDDALNNWRGPKATRIKKVLAADFRGALDGEAFDKAVDRLVMALTSS